MYFFINVPMPLLSFRYKSHQYKSSSKQISYEDFSFLILGDFYTISPLLYLTVTILSYIVGDHFMQKLELYLIETDYAILLETIICKF